MAFTKKYKCMNIGNCELADKKDVFEIPQGEEPKCPKCGSDSSMLLEVKQSKNGLMIGVIAIVVLAVALALFFILKPSTEPAEVEEQEQPEVTNIVPEEKAGGADVVVEDVEQPEAAEAPVVEEPAPAAETDKPAEAKPQPRTYNLGYGVYDGVMRGGVPHGEGGTIKITAHHTFTQGDITGTKVEAAPGDKVVSCIFRNGRLISGQLMRQNGQRVTLNLGSI